MDFLICNSKVFIKAFTMYLLLNWGLLALETSIFFTHDMEESLLGFKDLDEGTFSFLNGLIVVRASDVLLLERSLNFFKPFVKDSNLLFDFMLLFFLLRDNNLDIVLI